MITMFSLSIVGCSSTSQKSEVEINLADAITYFNDSHKEITKILGEKDTNKMINKLEKVITYLDEKTDYFLEEMSNYENPEDIK